MMGKYHGCPALALIQAVAQIAGSPFQPSSSDTENWS
jgi:hypothetical protein